MQIVKYTVAVAALLGLVQVDALRLKHQESTATLLPAENELVELPTDILIAQPVNTQAVAVSADAEEEDRYHDVQALVEDVETELDAGQLLDPASVEAMDLEKFMKYSTKFDAQLYVYHNLLRKEPKAFIPYLENVLSYSFTKEQGYFRQVTANGPHLRFTKEGKKPVEELIAFLKTDPKRPLLKWDKKLVRAAKALWKHQAPTGETGHVGKGGKTYADRIGKFKKFTGQASGENLIYGETSPLGALLSLAIDDGVASRADRQNIFNANYAYVGAYTGGHKKKGYMTAVDYAGASKPSKAKQETKTIPATVMRYRYSGFAEPSHTY